MKHLLSRAYRHMGKVILCIVIFIGGFVLLERLMPWLFTGAPAELVSFFESFGIWAAVVYVLLYVLLNLFSTPSVPLIFICGMLFGLWWGLLVAFIAEMLSAAVNFLLGRRMGHGLFDRRVENKRIKMFMKYINSHGFLTVFILRYIGLYFDLVSYASGMTKIKFKDYFYATALGFLPYLFVYVYAGQQLIDVQSSSFMYSILIMKLVLFGMFFIGLYLYNRTKQH